MRRKKMIILKDILANRFTYISIRYCLGFFLASRPFIFLHNHWLILFHEKIKLFFVKGVIGIKLLPDN